MIQEEVIHLDLQFQRAKSAWGQGVMAASGRNGDGNRKLGDV